MKKLIVLTLVVVSALPLVAQRYFYEPEYTIGARGGLSMSWVSFQPSVSYKLMYGAEAGAMFRFISDRHFGIQVEANFSQKGWREHTELYNFEHTLNYVEIPFMSHIYFGKNAFRWFFNLGPNIGYMVSDKIVSDISDPKYEDVHTSGNFKHKFDYGIVIGTGCEYRTQKAGIFQVEARYSLGLGNIFSADIDDEYTRSSNQNIQVCFAYLYDIPHRY